MDQMKTRVCVLLCACSPSSLAHPQRYSTGKLYDWTCAELHRATAVRQVQELITTDNVDVFVNLCDGSYDAAAPGIEVVETLERYECTYTGADKLFYEPSKALQKKLAYYYDVPTPHWAELQIIDMKDDIRALRQCDAAVKGLKFPLIVKHWSGSASVGMTKDSLVTDLTQLMPQVRHFVRLGGALIEEYIPGREFSVLVVDNPAEPHKPIALTPVECVFKSGETFKHADVSTDTITWKPLDAQSEANLFLQLQQHAANAFTAVRGVSYGTADFRVDDEGRVFFLEHNPQCAVFYPKDNWGAADFTLSVDPQMNHAQFLDHIIMAAQARRAAIKANKKIKVVAGSGTGFGLLAACDIAPGEMIVKFEETSHVLVSATHVRGVFGESAIPKPPSPASASNGGVANTSGLIDLSSACHQHTNGHAETDTSSASGTSQTSECDSLVCGPAAPCSACLAERSRKGDRRWLEWFNSYAFPLTDEVWVTWSEDPERWLPLNHSCDPNAWLEGLDLVARKHIKTGEQVTCEYATFTAHNLASFNCQCGAPNCRGVVGGHDYLLPWVEQVYGGHVSDYVRTKRRKHGLTAP